MVRKDILPSIEMYLSKVAETASLKQKVDSKMSISYEKNIMNKLSSLNDIIFAGVDTLEKVLEEEQAIEDIVEQGYAIRDKVLPTMEELREACDQAEMIVAKEYWPYPSYGEMLFGVK
jgi:glutamine synthetase